MEAKQLENHSSAPKPPRINSRVPPGSSSNRTGSKSNGNQNSNSHGNSANSGTGPKPSPPPDNVVEIASKTKNTEDKPSKEKAQQASDIDNLVSSNTTIIQPTAMNRRIGPLVGKNLPAPSVNANGIANDLLAGEKTGKPSASLVTALESKLSPAKLNEVKRELNEARAYQAKAEHNLTGGNQKVDPGSVPGTQAQKTAKDLLDSSSETTVNGKGQSKVDITNLGDKLEQLSKTDPAQALAAKSVLDSKLTPDQVGDLNRQLGGGRTFVEKLDLATSSPLEATKGVAKEMANGLIAVGEMLAKGATMRSAGQQQQAGAIQSLFNPEQGKAMMDSAAETMAAAKNIDLPQFEMSNGAQEGGAIIGTAIDIAMAGKVLVTGGAKLAVKNADNVAETVTKKSDTVNTPKGTTSLSSEVPAQFRKKDGGSTADDFISPHSEKHMYNPAKTSTPNRSQFGQDVDVKALVEDTVQNYTTKSVHPDSGITKYAKTYDFNISTPDTPTGEMRVFINTSKPDRSTQFPYVPRNQAE